MQRRAAAVYFVFFLVVGAGAYGTLAMIEQPQIELEAQSYNANDTFSLAGQTYTVDSIEAEQSSEGGGTSYTGVISWQNESAVFTATLANGSTTTYQNDTYLVDTRPNESAFTLVEQQNVSAILANDSDVANETSTIDGEESVVYTENNSYEPLSEYLPEPEQVNVSVGDSYPHEGNTTTVASVNNSSVALEWTGMATMTTPEFSEGSNVTLGSTTYFAHFPSDQSVQILPYSEYSADYQQQLDAQSYYEERKTGLWGVIGLSVIAAIILLATAYLPVRG
jgi:hypothetical protein